MSRQPRSEQWERLKPLVLPKRDFYNMNIKEWMQLSTDYATGTDLHLHTISDGAGTHTTVFNEIYKNNLLKTCLYLAPLFNELNNKLDKLQEKDEKLSVIISQLEELVQSYDSKRGPDKIPQRVNTLKEMRELVGGRKKATVKTSTRKSTQGKRQ
jgi:hypothetical protein